ncbi:hypothetical protein C1Y63_03910 [Corynebacterium sp. 13CS0277]|uniref:hypothetical protein n=1 Tax=Corynebacterium sp. 13CS0277 TaxID=2071994 RepID=UPI000D03E3C9|nr:hypothetical protein [Corynebacterium sp. 13CS0277]PRQ11797.1 hypothetical protein C1Y63_03910 [Corynebacterium sp. 13CS0277]
MTDMHSSAAETAHAAETIAAQLAPTPAAAPAGPKSVTRTILALHRRLWRHSMRGATATIVQLVFMLMYSLPIAAGAALYLAVSELAAPEAFIAAPALGVLMFWLFAGIMPSTEFQIQPEKFATLPISPAALGRGMAVATLLQLRSGIAMLCTLITIIGGSVGLALNGQGWWVPAWVLTNVGACGLAILGAEAIAQTANLATNRKSKERRGMIATIAFLGVWFAFSMVTNGNLLGDWVFTFGRYAALTPFGALTGIVPAIIMGQWWLAAGAAIIAVATVVFLWWLWVRSFRTALAEPTANDVDTSARSDSDTILLRGQSATPGGALRSRVWRYARRDTRLSQSLIVMPVLATGFVAMGLVMEDSPMPYVAGFFLAMAVGTLMINALGLDGPANWIHISCGVPPRVLLRNYVVAYSSLMAPLVPVFLLALYFVDPDSQFLPYVVVVMPAMCLSNLAVSVVLCVYNPYPTARPGTPAMKDRSQQSGGAFISAFAGLGGGALPLLPGVIVMVLWNFTAGAVLTLLIGAGLLWGGLRLAGRRLDTHWPEVFAKVNAYV